MKKAIGASMLALVFILFIAPYVIRFGWWAVLGVVGVVGIVFWIFVAVNLLTDNPPFSFPGINE